MDRGCAGCHNGALLGGNTLQRFGVVKDYWLATGSEKRDTGRHAITTNEADRYVFRVAMLRNVARTAPYFHDGSVATLDAAVRVMAALQLGQTPTDQEVGSIRGVSRIADGRVAGALCPAAIRRRDVGRRRRATGKQYRGRHGVPKTKPSAAAADALVTPPRAARRKETNEQISPD